MSDPETREGGCHCGAVAYRATVDLGQTMQCNCSHCQAKGFILTFVPADAFELLSGEDSLAEYRFHKHVIAHRFCKVCGVQPFGEGAMPDGTPTVAVNVRTIAGIDLDALSPQSVDGRSF